MSLTAGKIKLLTKTLGPAEKVGSEYLFSCPKCKHHKKKLSINTSKDVWKCWVCEYAGVGLEKLIRRWGTRESFEEYTDSCGGNKLTISQAADKLLAALSKEEESEAPDPVMELPPEYKNLSRVDLSFDRSMAMQYLKGRGLTHEDIVRWQIGYAALGEYSGRIIIPSFNKNGDCNFFVTRSYCEHFYKYKNPQMPKTEMIFNELFVDWKKDIVLVEGVFDAIKSGGIPLLGSSLKNNSKLFREIVRNNSVVYLALDADAESKSDNLIKNLLKYEITILKIETSDIEDVGSLSKEEFEIRKRNAQEVDESYLLYSKLRSII